MIYLISLYSLLSALAVVIAVMHMQYVPAFCITILSLFAVRAGSEARYLFTNDSAPVHKIGRLLLVAALAVVSLHLSLHYNVNIFIRVVDGIVWSVLGMAVGALTTSTALLKRAQMKLKR